MKTPDTPESRRALGNKIKALRELYGWTQLELAHRLGYSSSGTVSHIENGNSYMKSEKLLKAAKVFNVPVEVLVSPHEMENEALEMVLNLMKMIQKPDKSIHYQAIKELLKISSEE